MLITKSIKIEVNKGNLGYYNKKMNNKFKIGQKIDVPMKYISKSKVTKVKVACDICNGEKNINYNSYNLSLNYGFYSCSKCKHIKRKMTNKKKYGKENYNNIKKRKETNKRKYGVEYATQSEKIKLKTKKTNIDKYGVDNPSKFDKFKEKRKETNKKNWKVENVFQSEEVKEKIKKTTLKKYGVSHNSKNKLIKQKKEKTCLLNHGVKYPSQSKEIKQKIRKSFLDNYDAEYYKKIHLNEENRKHFLLTKNKFYLKYLGDGISYFRCDNGGNHNFEIKSDNYYYRNKENIKLCTICYPIDSLSSIKEKEIYKFISDNYEGEVINSYRDGLEIDIYIPDLKIGIEINGLYYHSSKFKDKNYHINKTKYFKKRGIKIIHIWEDEIILKKNIVHSMLLSIMKKSKKIYAINCEVKEIKDQKLIKYFIEKNYIKGYKNSNNKLYIGLFYEKKLVHIMSFEPLENYNYNISLFCSKLNNVIIDGTSKIIKHFIKNYKVSYLIGHVDISISDGNLYKKLGFKLAKTSYPNYKYVIGNKRVDISDLNECKDINKIYDCGELKFIKEFD